MSVLSLIATKNYIAVNKRLAVVVGLHEAIMLGELASEYEYWKERGEVSEDGFFFSTIENVQCNTTLSEKQQRNALKNLSMLGFVETRVKGIPAKRFIRLDENNLTTFLANKFRQNGGTGTAEMAELDTPKGRGNKNNTNKNNNKKERGDKPLIPPTFEEISEYIRSRGSKIDAKRFYDFFNTPDDNGRTWIDSNGKPVRNWKQKVITWEGRQAADTTKKAVQPPPPEEQRDYHQKMAEQTREAIKSLKQAEEMEEKRREVLREYFDRTGKSVAGFDADKP